MSKVCWKWIGSFSPMLKGHKYYNKINQRLLPDLALLSNALVERPRFKWHRTQLPTINTCLLSKASEGISVPQKKSIANLSTLNHGSKQQCQVIKLIHKLNRIWSLKADAVLLYHFRQTIDQHSLNLSTFSEENKSGWDVKNIYI